MKKFFIKIKKSIFFFNYKILRKLRILLSINQTLKINNKKLILPPDHLLSLYNKIYPNYDKFLEKFIINRNNLNIIDIGANVGDTLLRILSNNNNYYCIEPNDYFLKYLKKNVKNNLDKHENVKIKIIDDLIGEELEGFLDNRNGTASLKKDSKTSKKLYSKKLDEIISLNKISKVDIIKCDTDGFDVNVLKSGFKIIKKDMPILFFEYLNIETLQLEKYINFISELKLIGYKKFIILNNYGEIILENNNIKKIRDVMTGKDVVDIYTSVN
jgi:FkbM family methyltransferase